MTNPANQRLGAKLERAKGIEPSYAAWEAAVLPLNYARGLLWLASLAAAGKPTGRWPQGDEFGLTAVKVWLEVWFR